ncbi:hypothetical protein [Thiohalomonas denitrificans]|nr:hypothetical protein [Thiohalomonas denitrificans]
MTRTPPSALLGIAPAMNGDVIEEEVDLAGDFVKLLVCRRRPEATIAE